MVVTAKELDERIAALIEADEESEEYKYQVYGNIWDAFKYNDIDYPIDLGDGISITRTVDEFGGMEQGSEFWVVVEVETPDGPQLFRKDGYYQSYDGGYLDGDTVEVESYEETVVRYRSVK